MTYTRSAWWDRARWFFLLYAFVAASAIFATPHDLVIGGWKVALTVSAVAAAVGTGGTLRVVLGHSRRHPLFAQLEAAGFIGMASFEMLHGLYAVVVAVQLHDPGWLARAAAHLSLTVALGLAYPSRPVREGRRQA